MVVPTLIVAKTMLIPQGMKKIQFLYTIDFTNSGFIPLGPCKSWSLPGGGGVHGGSSSQISDPA